MADPQVLNTNADLDGNTLLTAENAYTITGVQTHSVAPVVNAGVKFPAVQVPVADVNTLDDYEEGSWTPTITGSGGGSGQVYSGQLGRYTKIGQHVYVIGRLMLSTLGTITTAARITGLPFTAQATVNLHPPCVITYFGGLTTSVSSIAGIVMPNTTAIDLYYVAAAGSTSVSAVVQGTLSNSTDLIFSAHYII